MTAQYALEIDESEVFYTFELHMRMATIAGSSSRIRRWAGVFIRLIEINWLLDRSTIRITDQDELLLRHLCRQTLSWCFSRLLTPTVQ